MRDTLWHSWFGLYSLRCKELEMFHIIWVVVSRIFYFHPYLGKIPMLTNIFQRGWNHQLVILILKMMWHRWVNGEPNHSIHDCFVVWIDRNLFRVPFKTRRLPMESNRVVSSTKVFQPHICIWQSVISYQISITLRTYHGQNTCLTKITADKI